MTDRLNALVVVLENDIRHDDAVPIMSAIEQIKGVLKVSWNTTSVDSLVATERVRTEFGRKMWEILYPKEPA